MNLAPFVVEKLVEERQKTLLRAMGPSIDCSKARGALSARERLARVLVKVGMIVDHRAGERAAVHTHHEVRGAC